MRFTEFETLLAQHFQSMTRDATHLYVVDLDRDQLWETYLNAFPPGTNQIYRTRREFDCSCCRNFIKTFGNVVAIKGTQIVTLWDFDPQDPTYSPVTEALSAYVHAAAIRDVLVTGESRFGTEASLDFSGDQAITWNHFYLALPRAFVYAGRTPVNEVQSEYRASYAVFTRALREFKPEAIESLIEMIEEGIVYRGTEALPVLQKFSLAQNRYLTLQEKDAAIHVWHILPKLPLPVLRLHGTALGTLVGNLSEGMSMDEALRRYESLMAPSNYRRPAAKFTAKMVEKAQKEIEALGLTAALPRRFAVPADLTINNVLWANRNAVRGNALTVFDALKEEVQVDVQRLPPMPTYNIETFLAEVLPTLTSLEVLVENTHVGNLVSLLAPQDPEAPHLFPWGNFSWSYAGNVADAMKTRVKAAGGKVDGVLRYSIQWNENNDNPNDFDAHCREPGGFEICYRQKVNPSTGGNLDVDIVNPSGIAVENITWARLDKMRDGTYTFFTHNFSHRGGRSGFRAEIEFEGKIFAYNYPGYFAQGEDIQVARVTKRRDTFSIEHLLEASASTQDAWNLKTMRFHPVSTVLLSPNFWDEYHHGNKHYFFMLAGCVNPEQPNGFYNEFLLPELRPHRQVLEALSARLKVPTSATQLSGLGFSSTLRHALICKVNGKLLKIVF